MLIFQILHKILKQSIVAHHVVIKKGETYLYCVGVSDQTPVQMKIQSDKTIKPAEMFPGTNGR